MTDQEIIRALRCVSSPEPERDCGTCPYFRKETLSEEIQDRLGIKTWDSCDVDRIGLDAADRLELRAEQLELARGERDVVQKRLIELESGGGNGN